MINIKYKELSYNDKYSLIQHPWLTIFPTFILFPIKNDKKFKKISSLQFNWIYWELNINLEK